MRVPESLLSTFTKIGGGRFRGFLTAPAIGNTATLQPLRLLHVPRPCNVVRACAVVTDPQGTKFLLMDSPQGMVDTWSFRAVQVSQEYSWERKFKGKDPVSGMERDNGSVDMGVIYAYLENPVEVSLERLTETRYQFYTGQDVQVGDTVSGKAVKQVSKVLGVNLVLAE